MDVFFEHSESRFAAAGMFLVVAGVLIALAWAGRQRKIHWPMLVVALIGIIAWQLTAFALLVDGATTAGLLLSGIIFVIFVASVGTFFINEHAWIIAVEFALLGVGALFFPGEPIGFWVAAGCAVVLLGLCGIVLFNGKWWPRIAYAVAALMLFAIGAATALAVSSGVRLLWSSLFSIRAEQPIWLLVLLLIPLTIWWSFRSLAGLGPVRRWIALGLRCSLFLLLALALAEVYLLRTNETVTVLFLWDRSLSIPEEFDPNEPGELKTDLVAKRHLGFINNSVAQRGPKQQRDHAGLIVFGRFPRLELPPSNVPHFRLKKITSTIDESYTDISAAIKLALACFPEGTGKRIVLISDGNENLGKAEEQARLAKQNGVEIDTVLVSPGGRNEQEIIVERIEVPPVTEAETRLPVRIVIRSYSPRTVVGRLILNRTSLKMPAAKDQTSDFPVTFQRSKVEEQLVRVRFGLNAFYLQQPGLEEVESHIYEARFVPLGVERTPVTLDEAGVAQLDSSGVKQDRPKNNYASASVLARGEKKLLLIEGAAGDHFHLLQTLRESKSTLKVAAITPAQLPQDQDTLNFLLGGFDCVILANVPRDSFTPEQDAALRTSVHEQGSGLIMLGGRSSYGAGGWQNTEVEKALPVTCDLKSLKVDGRSGLVLIMHASEIAEGNMWQKNIAKLAINKLGPMDMLGMLFYDGDHRWHIPFETVGENKASMLALVDTMNPGDMPDAAPSLTKARDALVDPKHNLGTKHIIFISDGDHWQPPVALLQQIKAAKITLTTVCVTSHGQGEYKNMAFTAGITGGRSYPMPNADGTFTPLDPRQLPEIYIKETRLVSQSFIHDKTFQPNLLQRAGPTDGLPATLPLLHGFVRTSPRSNPLVHLPIMSPKLGEMPWPIVAHWQYGLGKAVAYTSDALTTPKQTFWDRDWANSEMYAQFWNQLVAWSLRELDDGKNLQMTTEWRDGKVHIVVTAQDDNRKPLTDLDIIVRVTTPTPAGEIGRPDIKLQQKNVGRYEAEIRAEDIGSYFLTAMAYRPKQVKAADGSTQLIREPAGMVRSAVTVPYSPEFGEMEGNPALLERLSTATGGRVFADESGTLEQVAREGLVFRPSTSRSKALQSIWHWLLVLTGIGMFFDVAVRRIAVEPAAAASLVRDQWQRLRGMQPVAAKSQPFFDRLKGRKEQIGESMEKEKAARRFEGTERAVEVPPMADAGPNVEPKPPATSASTVKPKEEPEAADYASRLLRAKRKAMEEREKSNKPPNDDSST